MPIPMLPFLFLLFSVWPLCLLQVLLRKSELEVASARPRARSRRTAFIVTASLMMVLESFYTQGFIKFDKE